MTTRQATKKPTIEEIKAEAKQQGILEERYRILTALNQNQYRGDWNSPCAKWAIELIEDGQDD
jgi:hypothetical protein